MITPVLLHQGIGIEAFNDLPTRRAVHALYGCANSLTLAAELARERPYSSHDALFRRADALLFALPEDAIDDILTAHPRIMNRLGSAHAMHNDVETERKIVRDEIAKVHRSRLERLLGPEGGYDNWR
jgi:hypothetical protein